MLAQAQEPPPKILFDQSPRAIEYQLGRLNNSELVRVERKEDDPKYRLVYYALLTRKGLGREYFDEALSALTKMDKASADAGSCLTACPKIRAGRHGDRGKTDPLPFRPAGGALRQERAALAEADRESAVAR